MKRGALLTAAALCALSACQPRTVRQPQPGGATATPHTMPRDTVHIDQLRPVLDTTAAHAVAAHDDVTGTRAAGYVESSSRVALPAVAREFRGVWIATVHNMDWPSRRDLTTAEAQHELIGILDAARDLGLNAVIFQVRPAADALYDSDLEPWSAFLTGRQGRAPDPYWDPLAFAIEEAHARGLELHAWFNPFRAGFVSGRSEPAPDHVRQRRPDLVRRYGAHYWMDPAAPDARTHALEVISDVVRRYDIDAVHLDDYFYPYQERDSRRRLIQFPDNATWQRYGVATGMSRADWRRSNIDAFVERLYHTVHGIKPHVRIGISPFGIWRPGHPESVRGLDSYAELFADSRKWLANGWADYYAPQLYWKTYAPQQDYATLLQWWSDQNSHGRHIWAGNIPNSITGSARGWRASEILEQIRLTREQPGASGNIHFSASALLRNPDGLGDAFRSTVYAAPALVPASPWLSPGRPMKPVLAFEQNAASAVTTLRPVNAPARPSRWIVRARWGESWRTMLVPGSMDELNVQWLNGAPADVIAVSAVDQAGVEGEPAVFVRAACTNVGVRIC